jgi:hypothetical protein
MDNLDAVAEENAEKTPRKRREKFPASLRLDGNDESGTSPTNGDTEPHL